MLPFFKVLNFCFPLVYKIVFLLDNFSVLVNIPHQFHSKLNVALVLKFYLFSWFSQSFNDMDNFTEVSLETIFYAVSVIFLPHVFWDPISFLFYISTILFFLLRLSLRWSMVFCAASIIILITCWIEDFLYLCDKSRALFNSSQWLLCCSIYWCACNKAYFYHNS